MEMGEGGEGGGLKKKGGDWLGKSGEGGDRLLADIPLAD